MNRNKYSAGAVKFALWFMEFPKEVQLLSQGKLFFQSTSTARIQNMNPLKATPMGGRWRGER